MILQRQSNIACITRLGYDALTISPVAPRVFSRTGSIRYGSPASTGARKATRAWLKLYSTTHGNHQRDSHTFPNTEGASEHTADSLQTIDLDLKPAKDAKSATCLNRGVVLTGGTGGIGLAVAKRLAQEGAGRIVLVTRDSQRGQAAIEKIKEQTSLHDAPVSLLVADLTSDTDSIRTLLQRFTYCNTLINCAGITQQQSILKTTIQQQDQIIQTNLSAPITLARHFLYHHHHSLKNRQKIPMSDRPPGFNDNVAQSYCLVHVSSLLAYKGVLGTADYAATKAGIIAHTRALVLEGSRYQSMPGGRSPFRANVVVPGYIDTSMLDDFTDERRRVLMNSIPLKRFGSPEEVADAILFLVENEYADNCVLNLDGGMSAL